MYVFEGLYQNIYSKFFIQICYTYKRHIKLLKYKEKNMELFLKEGFVDLFGKNKIKNETVRFRQ